MPTEIGVLVVHGMGEQSSTFADPMIEELEQRLKKQGFAPGTVAWQRGYWADILNDAETSLWERMRKGANLDYGKLRQFFLSAFGDAVAYRRAEGEMATYDLIHDRIRSSLQSLRVSLGNVDRPIVVVAHSLAGVIISDYIWNEQRSNALARGRTPIEKMETLCGLVTFGCNIPLFTLALPKVESIAFPPKVLPEPIKSAARWINFYDPDDVLGWPLKPLSASYTRAVDADYAINVGGLMTSWNPAAHSDYWTDDSFTKPVVDLLGSLITAARTTPLPVVLPRDAAVPRTRPVAATRRG